MKGTLSFMYRKVKFKRPSGFMVECFFVFNSHDCSNFHSIEKNKISKSKSGSHLSKLNSISIIQQKAFVLLDLFWGHSVNQIGLVKNIPGIISYCHMKFGLKDLIRKILETRILLSKRAICESFFLVITLRAPVCF